MKAPALSVALLVAAACTGCGSNRESDDAARRDAAAHVVFTVISAHPAGGQAPAGQDAAFQALSDAIFRKQYQRFDFFAEKPPRIVIAAAPAHYMALALALNPAPMTLEQKREREDFVNDLSKAIREMPIYFETQRVVRAAEAEIKKSGIAAKYPCTLLRVTVYTSALGSPAVSVDIVGSGTSAVAVAMNSRQMGSIRSCPMPYCFPDMVYEEKASYACYGADAKGNLTTYTVDAGALSNAIATEEANLEAVANARNARAAEIGPMTGSFLYMGPTVTSN